MEKHAKDRKDRAIKKLAPPPGASLLCSPQSPLELSVILIKGHLSISTFLWP
jgi:hypothetical protein